MVCNADCMRSLPFRQAPPRQAAAARRPDSLFPSRPSPSIHAARVAPRDARLLYRRPIEHDELAPREERGVGDGRVARATRSIGRQSRAYGGLIWALAALLVAASREFVIGGAAASDQSAAKDPPRPSGHKERLAGLRADLHGVSFPLIRFRCLRRRAVRTSGRSSNRRAAPLRAVRRALTGGRLPGH